MGVADRVSVATVLATWARFNRTVAVWQLAVR